MKKRLPSYTLLELVVVMLLTTIVASIVFLTLNILEVSLKKFKSESETLLKMGLLKRLLTQDFLESSQIINITDGLIINTQSGNVIYNFKPTSISRTKAGVADSFYLKTSPLIKKFYSEPIEMPNYIINELNFEIYCKNEVFTYIVKKQYGADMLMSWERDKGTFNEKQ
ncbi:MAG: hypothetical protein H7329_00540 [Opitutaceae bacterium]|nr:hypothetical protein [Cytophagales bacterium]